MEAAKRLAIADVSGNPHELILKMVRQGKLVGVKVGKWIRVLESSVDAYITGEVR